MSKSRSISLKEINRLALPAILSGIAEPLIALADTAMVGRLGTTPLGAVGLGSSLFLLTIWVLTQTKTAISAIVSRHYGAKSLPTIKTLIPQAFLFNIILGFIILIVMFSFARDLLSLYSAKGEILNLATDYFKIRCLGLPIVLATYGMFGVFRGLQNTAWAMQISIVGGVLNLILDYFLIFGIGPFEAMGIKGAAYASLFAQMIMLVLSTIYFLKNTPFNFKLKYKLNSEFKFLIGMSSGFIIRTIALNIAFFLANRYATSYGDEHIAAHTIAINIWLFSSYFIDGYANAGNAISGRLFGEKRFEELYTVGMKLMKISMLIGCILGSFYFIFYNYIPMIFDLETGVVHLFESIFWILILSQPINAIAFAFDGIFKGLGRSKYLMYTLLIASFLGFVPVLIISDKYQFGLHGIWAAFVVFMVIRGLTLLWKFRKDFAPS
ncbi:MAG: MATE family multidrug resistance protein [Patiriisocius sp.]|jgi:MATE family multidrug resistance protein